VSAPTTKSPRRAFGHIFKKPQSRFWYVRYHVGGKEYVESARSEKVRDAEKLLDRKAAELGLGVFVAPDVKRTTFEDLCQMIRDDYRLNEHRSTSTLTGNLARLAETFAGQRAVTLTLDRLQAYARARLEQGVAPQTIRNQLNALKHALRLAKRAGKVTSVPEFPLLAPAGVRTGFFEPDDVAALLVELPEPLRAPVEFAYLTGWRKSEVLGLTWDRVDFDAGMVRLDVGTTKTGAGRTFPFGVLPRLKSLLDGQRARTTVVQRRTEQIIQHVFHREGAPIKDMFAAWTNACARASQNDRGLIVRPQLLGRVFHDLRRTAVRNLVRAGVPEHTAMKLSGHKTRSVFDRYDIVSERDLSEGVVKLATFHQQTGAR
jgi:integrase